MKTSSDIKSFSDFWPRYLSAHADPGPRALHFLGLVLSLALAAALIASGMIFFLILAVVPAHLGAWLGHKLSPRHDSISHEHPGWAALADVKMFASFLTGKLGAELAKHVDLASIPSRPRFST